MRAYGYAFGVWAHALWLVALYATLPGQHVGIELPDDLQALLDEEAAEDDEEDDGFSVEVVDDKTKDKPKKKVKARGPQLPLAELTEANFSEFVAKYQYTFVKFYYPDDERCQEFIGPAEEVAASLAKRDPPIGVGQVDATTQESLVDTFGIKQMSSTHGQGYVWMPTFHSFAFGMHARNFYIKGSPVTTKEITRQFTRVMVNHPKEQAVHEIEADDKGGLKRFRLSTRENDIALIYSGYKNSAKALVFKKAVKDFQHYRAVTNIRAAIVNASKADGIKMTMYRPGFSGVDATELEYSGKWDAVAIGRWAKKNTYPTVGHKFSINKYGWSALNELFLEASVVVLLGEDAVGLEACKVIDDEGVCAGGQEGLQEPLKPKVFGAEGEEAPDEGATSIMSSHLTSVLHVLAIKYKNWRFVITSASEVIATEREFLGWRNNSGAMVTVLKDKRRYIMDDQEALLKPTGLSDWLVEVSAGEVLPVWKTEATEEGQPTEVAEGILVLRGDTFEEYAFDPSMDVLVLFHWSGCGVCEETIEPVLRDLDKRLQEQLWRSGVVLAKFDALNNECIEDVHSVPKLVIYPAVEVHKKLKERQVYPGLWDLEPITEFLVKYSKNIEEKHWFDEKKAKATKKVPEKVLKDKVIPQDRRRRTVD